MTDRIILFIGASSSGKNYLLNKSLEENPNAQRIVTYTTRPIRNEAHEVNHIDYHFINDDRFDVLRLTGRLMEERTYNVKDNGKDAIWRYGTPYFVDEFCHEYYGVLDVSGAEVICKNYPNAEVIVYYVYAPEDVRTKRAEKRGNFKRDEWERRLKADEEDFSEEKLAKLDAVLRLYGNPPITEIKNY